MKWYEVIIVLIVLCVPLACAPKETAIEAPEALDTPWISQVHRLQPKCIYAIIPPEVPFVAARQGVWLEYKAYRKMRDGTSTVPDFDLAPPKMKEKYFEEMTSR